MVYGMGSKQLFIITVMENDTLLGIVPLYLNKSQKIFQKEIAFLGSNIVCSDYLDFILLKGREEDLLSATASLLKVNGECWDVLRFSDMPSDSKPLSFIESFSKDGSIKVNKNYTVCYYIDLKSPWDEIFSAYSPMIKNTIRQKTKKLRKFNGAEFYEVSNGDDVNNYFLELVRLNKLRLKTKGIQSPFYQEYFLDFQKRAIKELYNKGMAKLYFLKVAEKLIAGIYILTHKNKFYFYQSGFDPAWSQLSPGTLLFNHVIKESHSKKAVEFDLLQGEEEYKSHWAKKRRINIEVKIYNSNVKGRLLKYFDGGNVYLRKLKRQLMGRDKIRGVEHNQKEQANVGENLKLLA
jgi:hypothetical protein